MGPRESLPGSKPTVRTADRRAAAELTLVPPDDAPRWSIDSEPMGPGWHDSSWMLRKGLDVIEGLPPGATPPEWAWTWWVASFGGLQRPA